MKYKFDTTVEPDKYLNSGILWAEFAADGYRGGAILNIDSGENHIRGVYGEFDSNGYVQFDLPQDFPIGKGFILLELSIEKYLKRETDSGLSAGSARETVQWLNPVLQPV